MSSGVAVDPSCVETFKKLIKDRAYRGAIFTINDTMTLVEVSKTYPPKEGQAAWEEVCKDLPADQPRYIVYDFEYESQGIKKNRVIFVLWSPDDSKVRLKMIYAASQEGVVTSMDGVQRALQANDADEISYKSISSALLAHTASY